MRYQFFIILTVMFAFSFSYAQGDQEITGTVMDSDGIPVPGVNITVQGTDRGTSTDFDGNFSITAPQGSTLLFSSVGYEDHTEVVGAETTLNIVMQEGQALDEVVVVGYGTQKKSDVTGAITSVKAEDLEKITSTNVLDALQGKVSGVSISNSTGAPGGSPEVNIRGIGTFGNNQPLYIVDGVESDPYFLNDSDIESMEILKDASSTAIYGTRAANGVVMITTKKGKKGKPSVSVNSSYSINNQRKKMKLLDADGYVQVLTKMYENAEIPLPNFVSNPPNINTDWLKATQRSGYLLKNDVNVSGATDVINYSVSGNFAKEEGVLIGTDFRQKGFNSNINIDKGKLHVDTKIQYAETNNRPLTFSIREAYFISPLIPIYDDSKSYGFGIRDGDIPDHRNPVGDNHFIQEQNKDQYLLGNIGISYDILDNLKIGTRLSMSNLNTYEYNFHQPFQTRAVSDNPQDPYAFLSENNILLRRYNAEYTLHYNFDLGLHNFELLAGYQRIREPLRNTFTQVEGFKNDSDGNKIPSQILDPNFDTMDAISDGTYTASGTRSTYTLASQFGRLNYSFDDKYLFQASIRRDGSSKFGENHKYGYFPSFAVGWKITEEKFMQNQNVFSQLKLRYSWGQSGNDSALDNYAYAALISQGLSSGDGGYVFGSPQTSVIGSIARSPDNPNLKWETQTASNLGLDFTSLGGRFSGSLNYYNSETKDLLIVRELAPSAGLNNPVSNVGAFRNKGFELELNYRGNLSDLNYSIGATVTTINSKVTKLNDPEQVLLGRGLQFGSDHFVNKTKVGYAPGAFFMPVADGVFQNEQEIQDHSVNGELIQPNAKPGDIRFIDQNGDGKIDEGDDIYAGTPIPKIEYGLNIGLDYRNFDMTIFFQGSAGNKIYNGNDFRLLSMDTGRNYREATLNAWSPNNTDTDIPRPVIGDPNQNNRASTRFLHNGGYLRVKTIQLGYSLPENILQNTFINKVRVYFTGQNLFTITKYNGLDPEIGGTVLSRGIDESLYPKYKSYIMGLQLNF